MATPPRSKPASSRRASATTSWAPTADRRQLRLRRHRRLDPEGRHLPLQQRWDQQPVVRQDEPHLHDADVPDQGAQGGVVLVGNFYEDGHTDGTYHPDLLFYTPGTAPTPSGQRPRRQLRHRPEDHQRELRPGGRQLRLQGHVPGSSPTDILWYAPGRGADSVWMNNGTSFTSTPLAINATTYQPYVVPKLLAADAIMWNNTSGQTTSGGPTAWRIFSFLSTPVVDMGAPGSAGRDVRRPAAAPRPRPSRSAPTSCGPSRETWRPRRSTSGPGTTRPSGSCPWSEALDPDADEALLAQPEGLRRATPR